MKNLLISNDIYYLSSFIISILYFYFSPCYIFNDTFLDVNIFAMFMIILSLTLSRIINLILKIPFQKIFLIVLISLFIVDYIFFILCPIFRNYMPAI